MNAKLCRSCGETKPVDSFNRDKNRPDGLYCTCKQCRKTRDATKATMPHKRGPKRIDERPAYEPNPLNIVAADWRMTHVGSVSKSGTITFLRNGADLAPMVRAEIAEAA